MAFTKKGDVFVPEMFVEAIQAGFAGMEMMDKSGAIIVNTSMPYGGSNVGESVKIPYFSNIGELEDIANDGDALTPVGITSSEEIATVNHSGKAIEATWWAQMSAVSDPYAEGARQMLEAVRRRAMKAATDICNTDANLLELDVSASNTKLDYDVMIDAKLKFGDEDGGIAALMVHSKVKADLRKLKTSTGVPLFIDGINGDVDRFTGVPVYTSDRLRVSSGTYTSLVLKRGSILIWLNGSPIVLTDKDILANTDVQAVHIYWAAHAYKNMPGYTKPGVCRILHKVGS
jgi:hypothetical protein